MPSPLKKSDFVGLDRYNWLYNGAETPPLRGLEEALGRYAAARALGPGGREANSTVEASCKANVAALLNGTMENIALLSNASEGIDAVAQSLRLGPGDNVVVNDLDFPSGILPWLAWREAGVEVRVVEHTDWHIKTAAILDKLDDRTRLVVTSHVSYLSGARLDYADLYNDLLFGSKALLLVDATQSLGVVPVDMMQADFVVSSSYKWLLGTHGVGVLAVNPTRTGGLQPGGAGWRSVPDIFTADRFAEYSPYDDARRFELGYPAYPSIYALEYSTRVLLQAGIDNISTHVLELGGRLIEALRSRGVTVMTPAGAEQRAGNIAVVCAAGDKVAAALRAEDILVWGGDGRVRASVHGFNDDGDIDRYVAALARHVAAAGDGST